MSAVINTAYSDMDDRERQRAYRRFVDDVSKAIRTANREIIHARIPALDREQFYRMAVALAQMRASYLDAVVHMNWEGGTESLATLKARRAMYEEARAGFEALEHAIENGYIELDE